MVTLAVLIFGAAHGQAQMVDLNANGMSDIWELVFGAGGLDPNGDPDQDGAPNLVEAIAGTDPFDSNSVPRISFAVSSSTNLTLNMPCALGKLYQLQSIEALAGGSNWTTEASVVAQSGSVVSFAAPASPAAKFFRIAISDVDTDRDGVNDWEEYKLGLDPAQASSNGQLDGNGQPMTDYAYVTGRLAAQNVMTISATDPTANQPDLGQSAINLGLFTITRGGFPLNAVTVNLALAGPGTGVAIESLDHSVLPRSVNFPVGVSYQTIPLNPLANTNLVTPVVATLKLLPGAGYRLGVASNASILIYPSATPTGTGLTGQYFTNASATYSSSANFNPANLVLTRLDPSIDFVWGSTTNPIPNNGYYCVRWTGQVEPQYSETYYFDTKSDDGVKLWVNDQLIIDKWLLQSATDWVGSISLQGGVRYNIKLEYFQGPGGAEAHLSWYSPSQPKQIIPASRLYATTVAPAPAAVTSPLFAVAFLGQPFSYTVTGANSPTRYTASPLPPGLGFNPTNGVISGTNNLAGDFQIMLTSSNSVGVGASILYLQVIDTGSSVVREVWNNVAGANVSDIPLSTPATLTNRLGTLEGITDYGDNYGERIRGYLTAPVTGNYYFWIAGSDSAELWISNDSEPVNKVRRAYVANGTGARQWNLQANQKSPWLALVAGQRYYLEILHKAGAGTNDNWSIGWLQDPLGTNSVPGGVVPGYVLSPYFAPPPAFIPGTLYSAGMLAQSGAASTAVGSATLRLSADGSQAVLKFSYSGLISPETAEHIHCDPYLSNPSQIMFDIDVTTPQADGSYVWNIAPVGTLSAADVVEIIQEGKAYINIHTVNYPSGEINGHFIPADGTRTFNPPPAAPAWTDDHSNSNAAARFLIQATFGPSQVEVANVQALGYEPWIDNQFALPATHHLPTVLAKVSSDPTTAYPGTLTFNTWWQQSVTAPDQLRQRVAFALSEMMVVSQQGILSNNGRALSSYYDSLLDNAFGNFRALLKSVTLTPAMGLFLDMRANDKGSIITGVHANENYAREIMQLFSIGLNRMWPDGTLVMDSQDNLVPTYDQNVIMGVASVFTGWNYYQSNQGNGRLPANWYPSANYTNPMVLVPTHHELGTKRLLDNVVLPAAQGSQADSTSTNFDLYSSQDLESALDSIFNNQNVGPFICRQLIQRLVTSNPSRDYLYRVVQTFNDNGSGVRGDLQAVIKAILLDYEARSSTFVNQSTFGKQREPLLRVTAVARAFPGPPSIGGTYSENGNRTITVTTTNAHRLNNADTVFLTLTDTSGLTVPPTQGYTVQTVPSSNTFTVNAPGLSSGTYTLAPNATISNMVTASVVTTNVITVSLSGHGLAVGNPVYLAFSTGGASNGVYQVIWMTNNNYFAVVTPDSAARSGSCLIPKWTGGGYTVQNHTNLTVSTSLPHWLLPGDTVYLDFSAAGSPADGQYQVVSSINATHFTAITTSVANQTQNGLTVFPLVAPPLVRSGSVVVQWNTWAMNATDTGSSSSLSQTPLNSPTVFNFFFPDYRFPGVLASAGLTTPEFQLTSDTSAALQMNFLESGLLVNGNNTNGLTSFNNRNGAIVLDVGFWMTPAYAADAGIPNLVDALNSLLIAGQLSGSARTTIINYVANPVNFPISSPTYMRDRVQAVVHLLINSPDFTVQR